MVSDEIALMLVLVGLYLYDSLLLLETNQAVVIRCWRNWGFGFGAQRWRLAGKEPYLPNPLTPWRRLYVLRWDMVVTQREAEAKAVEDPLPTRHQLDALTLPMTGIAAALFLLLPLGFFSSAGLLALVAAVIIFYVSTLLALWLAYRMRAAGELQVSSKSFGALAFQSLICPPFALNLVRKLSMKTADSPDFLATANVLFDEETMEEIKRRCYSRVEEKIQVDGEEGMQESLLAEARNRFQPKDPL